MTFDIEAYEERAAIMEFDGGMTRFQAEVKAAQAQGLSRWEAIGAISRRLLERERHQRSMAGQSRENDMPGMQRGAKEEARPMPKRVTD